MTEWALQHPYLTTLIVLGWGFLLWDVATQYIGRDE